VVWDLLIRGGVVRKFVVCLWLLMVSLVVMMWLNSGLSGCVSGFMVFVSSIVWCLVVWCLWIWCSVVLLICSSMCGLIILLISVLSLCRLVFV